MATLEQLVLDWLHEQFGIIGAEYQTRDQVITWWGYDLIVFPNKLKVNRMLGENGVRIAYFNISDPNFFNDLYVSVDWRIRRIRSMDRVGAFDTRTNTWD